MKSIKKSFFFPVALVSALIFVSCPSSGDDSNSTPVLPDNPTNGNKEFSLSGAEKAQISELTAKNLQDAIASMKKIVEILGSHTSEKGVKEYKEIIEKVQGALNINLEKVTGSDIADLVNKIEKVDYQAFISSKKEGSIEKYSNWYDYANEYDLALQEIEAYNSFYNNEYTTAFNNYDAAVKIYSEKVKNVSQPKYDTVESFAKNAVNDFKGITTKGYTFNGSYNENEIKSMVQSAVDEQNSLKSSLGADYTAYENAKKAYSEGYYDESTGTYVESAVSRLNYLNNNADFRVSEADRKGSNLQEITNGGNGNQGENQGENQGGNEDPVVFSPLSVPANLKGDAWTAYLNSDVWENAGAVTLSIPEGTTEVDVIDVVNKYRDIESKISSLGLQYDDENHGRSVSYPKSMPESVTGYTFDLTKTNGKNNVEFVRSLLNPKEDDDARNLAVGEKSEKEIMPGVIIVSYRELEYDGDKAWMQSIKFAKKTKVTMPTEYKLDDTYHGGIEGNVEFTNLGSATLSGAVYGMESLKPIYETFVKNAKDSELPKISLDFYSGSIDIDTLSASWDNSGIGGTLNLYGTEVDKLVARYIERPERISLPLGNHAFDATEYLDGGTMYNSDGSHNKTPYELDINAIHMMKGIALRNVYVTGDKKSDVTSFNNGMANVRFASDMNGVQFTSSARGVIEFEGEAPSFVRPGGYSKIILHKVSHETILDSSFVELGSGIDQTMANRLKGEYNTSSIDMYSESAIYPENNSAVWTTNESKVKPSENARWERAGNQGKGYGDVE